MDILLHKTLSAAQSFGRSEAPIHLRRIFFGLGPSPIIIIWSVYPLKYTFFKGNIVLNLNNLDNLVYYRSRSAFNRRQWNKTCWKSDQHLMSQKVLLKRDNNFKRHVPCHILKRDNVFMLQVTMPHLKKRKLLGHFSNFYVAANTFEYLLFCDTLTF